MTNTIPSILVLGGTGGTGRHVLRALRTLLPDARLSVACREPDRVRDMESAYAVHLIRWDATLPTSKAVEVLRPYSLIVNCLGPSRSFGTTVHRLCMTAGVDCLDLNDDPITARELWALHPEAVQTHTRLFTSMGMNPGLSTVFHAILREKLVSASTPPDAAAPESSTAVPLEEVHVCVLSGANEDAGLAATHTMIDCLTAQVTALREGVACSIPAQDTDDVAFVRFPSHGEKLFTAHCTSAEPILLEQAKSYAEGLASATGHDVPFGELVRNATYRMHFQGMPRGMVTWLRNSSLPRHPQFQKLLTRFFFTMHGASRKKEGNLDRSILAVFGSHQGKTGVISATGSTVFGMTAAFAAVVARIVLEHPETLPHGMHMAHPQWCPPQKLLSLLRQLGVEVSYATY